MKIKKIISGVIASAMSITMFAPVMAKDFPDTTAHWAQNAISIWSDRGVVKGDDAGNFRPGDSITRAETATVLDNLISYEKQSVKVFSDVSREDWFAIQISHLYEAKVITGYEDGTIRPSANISRQEAAVMFGRAFGLETDGVDTSNLSQFNDNDLIQPWAKPVVSLMASRGYIQGSDGNFRPGDPITRAEIVTILDNMVGIYADGAQQTYTGNFGNKFAVVKKSANFEGVTLGGAVISPSLSGKVNFNSGSKINGTLCNLSNNAIVSTAGATVASVSTPNGGTISTGGGGGYVNNGGSFGGGGSSGNSSINKKTTYSVTFNSNGGNFGLESAYSFTYTARTPLSANAPENPTREGYTFAGWYTEQVEDNNLEDYDPILLSTLVKSDMFLYAGWSKIAGKYGDIVPATGKDVAGTGISAADLMDKVNLDETKKTDVFNATGTLNYVSDYENAPGLNKEGHFIALTYSLPSKLSKPEDAELKTYFEDINESEILYTSFKDDYRDYTRVFYVTEEMQKKDLNIIFEVDLDGEAADNYYPYEITISISDLVLGKNPVTEVETEEELKTALSDKNIKKIIATKSIELVDEGTYAPGNNQGRKELVLSAPMVIPADGAITIKGLDISVSGTDIAGILQNKEAESAPSKATAIIFEDNTVKSSGLTAIFDSLSAKALTIKDNTFGTSDNAGVSAIIVASGDADDTVEITGNTFDNFATALNYKDNSKLTSDNKLDKNKFLNNTVDIELAPITTITPNAIPSVAYNYFDDTPVIKANDSDATAITSPLYTDTDMKTLSANEHDAYLFLDDVLLGKLSALEDFISLTFTDDEPINVTIVPTDLRDNNKVTINSNDTTTLAIAKAEAPATLEVVLGTDDDTKAHSIALTVAP